MFSSFLTDSKFVVDLWVVWAVLTLTCLVERLETDNTGSTRKLKQAKEILRGNYTRVVKKINKSTSETAWTAPPKVAKLYVTRSLALTFVKMMIMMMIVVVLVLVVMLMMMMMTMTMMTMTAVIMTMLMIMLAACWGQAVAARARTCHSCPWTSENDETDAGCWTYEHLNIWTSGEHLTLMRLRMDVVHLKIWWTSETEHLIIVDGATDDMIWWWQCYLCENLDFNEYTVRKKHPVSRLFENSWSQNQLFGRKLCQQWWSPSPHVAHVAVNCWVSIGNL